MIVHGMLGASPQPEFSLVVLFTLIVIAGASTAVFFLSVRRWTTRRQWVSLSEWARSRRMTLGSGDELGGGFAAMPPLNQLARFEPRVRMLVRARDGQTWVAQIETLALPVAGESVAAAETPATGVARWNLFVRQTQHTYTAAAARPTQLPASIVDLFGLTVFHSMSNERFVVLAADARSAVALSKGSARALLPPDVGLLFTGEHAVLDFSARPFDPVELDRMASVMDQIFRVC